MRRIYDPASQMYRELDATEARQEADRLQAENEQMRAALEPFADYANWDGVDEFEPPGGRRMDYVEAARRALGQPVSGK